MSERAARLRALHGGGELLVLTNAWDALSARLVESSGAAAVATSSAAVAWSRGHRDGEQLPLDELVAAVGQMARVLSVPLSVDLERGYADTPGGAAAAVARVVEAGAAGVNLEDGGEPPGLLASKIAAVRQVLGRGVFLNARTCVAMPMHGGLAGEALLSEVRSRARLYAEAGADGLFVPWLWTPSAIEAVARATTLPLNVLWSPATPPPAELTRLGVRRLSTGVLLATAAYTAAARVAEAVRQGRYGETSGGEMLMYPQLNGLLPAAGLAGGSRRERVNRAAGGRSECAWRDGRTRVS